MSSIVLVDRRLRAIVSVDIAAYFVFGVFEIFLPIYLYQLGVEAFMIGIAFAAQVLSIAIKSIIWENG